MVSVIIIMNEQCPFPQARPQAKEKCVSGHHGITHVNYELAFSMGTCHLTLQRLNQVLLQQPTFNTLRKEFRVESRNEALCAL